MQGSFRSRIAILAAAALCAVATASTYVVERVSWAWHRTVSWFVDRFDWLVSRIKLAKPQHLQAPRVALLGAIQMMGRMNRRDRPVVSPRWRMCPST
jgi:hypothetical protein